MKPKEDAELLWIAEQAMLCPVPGQLEARLNRLFGTAVNKQAVMMMLFVEACLKIRNKS